MAKILIATEKPFAPAAVAGIKAEAENAGHEVVLLEKYTLKAQLLEAVADVDAVIIRSDKIDKEVLDAAKNLKIVVRAGAGYDNVDLAAATAHNVIVENTPGQNANAVAELVLGLLALLNERTDLKYITDIKPDADTEFQKLEGRYFSTPKKMGAQTAEANTNAGIAAAKQINAYFAEGCTKFQVNK